MQRLCLTFSRGPELQYLAHLDLLRLWQRTLRRAGLPLLYSQGYSPAPKLSLACPLPVGVTGQAELLEFHLRQPQTPEAVVRAVQPCLPKGLVLRHVEELPASTPALSSLVRWTAYEVEVPTELSRQELVEAIQGLLAATTFPWKHQRDNAARHYDLRPLILGLEVLDSTPSGHRLGMRLRWDSQGAGRPEQVAAALGLPAPTRIHRTRVDVAQSAR
ncbi:MAG: DUF2344 domain-containing protein [Chloroflexi bacterium]|nr:DUF2344 domain-containing protein [Chloroflexota bacterium]